MPRNLQQDRASMLSSYTVDAEDDEMEESFQSDQTDAPSRLSPGVLESRRHLMNEITKLRSELERKDKDIDTLKELVKHNDLVWSEFKTAQRVVLKWSAELRQHSKRKVDHVDIEYKMKLFLNNGLSRNSINYILVLYRKEKFNIQHIRDWGGVDRERIGWTGKRTSWMRVASTKFSIEYHKDGNLLADPTSYTYAHPKGGIFKDHTAELTFEKKGFFSLITHVQFLIAAKLKKYVKIVAATGATMHFLENNYMECRVKHPLKQLPHVEPQRIDGSPNFQRASGYYFVDQQCMDIACTPVHERTWEQEDELDTECDVWSLGIEMLIEHNIKDFFIDPNLQNQRFGLQNHSCEAAPADLSTL